MNVAVLGLWHLGSVTAAATAAAGHRVRAWDPETSTVIGLEGGTPPIQEPGLADLLKQQIERGTLSVHRDRREALAGAEIIWITFDTPVDADDRADTAFVMDQVIAAMADAEPGSLFLLSSQLPIGTARTLEAEARARRPEAGFAFACSPENLRLGKALEVFSQPDRVVIGVRTEADRLRLAALFAPITDRLEWMSVESAEMTKHAVNSFLATSVAFINEIAAVAERMGADAREVERGLKTERRIGPSAYVSPGVAFAGGTLARDIAYIRAAGADTGVRTPLFDGVLESNLAHRAWPRRRLELELGSVRGKRIAIWGLTYKPGTDTLRRSESVALAEWLAGEGAIVTTHDPAVAALPADLAVRVRHVTDPVEALAKADALVVATEWPVYRTIDPDALAAALPSGLIIDANGFLRGRLDKDSRFRVVSVGRPS